MLKGKVAVVTGASRGIGAAVAKKLASLGADLALIYAGNDALAEAAAADCRALGVRAEAYRCDVSDGEAVKETVGKIKASLGGVQLLVNNAGITRDGLLIGMVGTAKMTLKESRDFYLIPSSALVPLSDGSDDGDSSVWVYDSATNSVSRRNVKVGVFVNDQAQILSGLKGGETIVSAGARFLTDGQNVRPVQK